MSSTSPQLPLTIAVIGAGPAGIFFTHAVEQLKRNKELKSDVEITVYERSSQPGGVWRSATGTEIASTVTNTQVNPTPPQQQPLEDVERMRNNDMYDQLWTNGSSHCIEFHDYTLDEHFQQPVTVYMKRHDLLSYMVGRVTNQCPDFFQKFVQFNTEVEYVQYDETTKKFRITTTNLQTHEKITKMYDKCIWACGENSKRRIPQQLIQLFQNGGFRGKIIHSADTSTLYEDVHNKRVLVIGGGFSAEDITLQAIKLGVQKVYVSTRLGTNEVTWTTRWPMNKVKVLKEQVPMKVTKDGTCIQFKEVAWTFDGYVSYSPDEVESEIHNIDTIIICTGYEPYLDFLDDELKFGYPGGEEYFSEKFMFDSPKDFQMKEGIFTKLTGNVELSPRLKYITWRAHPEFFRGILIKNPNMMFISAYGSDQPLLSIDVYARLLALYATGVKELPSTAQMHEINYNETIEMLQYPYLRYQMDMNYYNAITNLPNFWPKDSYEYPEEWEQSITEYTKHGALQMAWMMEEANYPFRTGTRYELNSNGEALINYGMQSYYHRYNQHDVTDATERKWKTFRDYENGHEYRSLFTGTKAIGLKKPWMLDNTTSDYDTTVNRDTNVSKSFLELNMIGMNEEVESSSSSDDESSDEESSSESSEGMESRMMASTSTSLPSSPTKIIVS